MHGEAIGAIITPNFGFCVQPRPVRCHGERHTGNYGFGLRILVILLNHGTKLLVSPVYLFQKVFAGSFIGAKFVWDVPLRHACFKCGVNHPAHSCSFCPSSSPSNTRSSGVTPNFRPFGLSQFSSLPYKCQPGSQVPHFQPQYALNTCFPFYDAQIVSFLQQGFTFGSPLQFSGQRVSFYAKNLASAYQNPEVVSAKLDNELHANRIAGPFKTPPFPIFRVSPLGVVPRKIPGTFCLIHHLSYPPGASINDVILSEHAMVAYSQVDDAIFLIQQLGWGCFLAKTDIKVELGVPITAEKTVGPQTTLTFAVLN